MIVIFADLLVMSSPLNDLWALRFCLVEDYFLLMPCTDTMTVLVFMKVLLFPFHY